MTARPVRRIAQEVRRDALVRHLATPATTAQILEAFPTTDTTLRKDLTALTAAGRIKPAGIGHRGHTRYQATRTETRS